jgi:hypothetical protein
MISTDVQASCSIAAATATLTSPAAVVTSALDLFQSYCSQTTKLKSCTSFIPSMQLLHMYYLDADRPSNANSTFNFDYHCTAANHRIRNPIPIFCSVQGQEINTCRSYRRPRSSGLRSSFGRAIVHSLASAHATSARIARGV